MHARTPAFKGPYLSAKPTPEGRFVLFFTHSIHAPRGKDALTTTRRWSSSRFGTYAKLSISAGPQTPF